MTIEAVPSAAQEAPKKRRGRENALDMVRSLGLVLIIVIVVWWLAQPPDSAEQRIRVVDSSGSVSTLLRSAPGTPVPTTPPDWKPTVDAEQRSGLRLGYVTPTEHYLEYAVSVAADPAFLGEITGRGTEVGTFDIAGVTWRQFSGRDAATSLVRTVGPATVVVGGVRETATLEELRVLAASVAPR